MPEMMKCFVMHGIDKVGMLDKPVPRPGPIDAIIRTTAALICTSDTHTVAGAIGDRHGLTLGHIILAPRKLHPLQCTRHECFRDGFPIGPPGIPCGQHFVERDA